jgi:transposase-like protein/IS1 family transposase
MNPQSLFCTNDACPSRGRQDAGNLVLHDRQKQRYRCKRCGKTFTATKGTPFYRLQTEPQTVVQVLTLLAFGCPLQAIVQAFALDERTIASWQQRAGVHCQGVHQALVCQSDLDLKQVQADEIRIKLQKRLIVWLAMALAVPTRLWLGGVVSPHHDKHLARTLARLVHACARLAPLLLVTDGWAAYKEAWRKAFCTRVLTGYRPRWELWSQTVLVQVVKWRQKGRVVGIRECQLVGDWTQIAGLLPGGQVLATAYIERLNATFRQRLCGLCRRTRCLWQQPARLEAGMYLLGCVYNFCTPHKSLRQRQTQGRKYQLRTPAMAAGLTGHIWSVEELLRFRLPPPGLLKPSIPKHNRRLSALERSKLLDTL